jgi:uncharacterized protein (TIGR02453 family)
VAGGFTGWSGDFQEFFIGLRANNSKAFFDSHRSEYENVVKGPMVALLADLESEFGRAHLSRPNRDIRFSADKSPYKLNIYASTASGGYVALDGEGLVAAGGRYLMDTAQLARFREAIANDRSGAELGEVVAALQDKGYEVGGRELKRVPRPYLPEHPRADLLRHKHLIYWQRWPIERWIRTSHARDRIVEVWRDGDRLNDWMTRHVDGR